MYYTLLMAMCFAAAYGQGNVGGGGGDCAVDNAVKTAALFDWCPIRPSNSEWRKSELLPESCTIVDEIIEVDLPLIRFQKGDCFYECECIDPVNQCDSSPCVYGSCIDGYDKYICDCQPGYTGENCEMEINECDSSPCVFGSCTDNVNYYECDCDATYIGSDCEQGVCEVSQWTAYDSCTVTCGGGQHTRTRNVTVLPIGVPTVCPALTESQPCNTMVCPVDCQVKYLH